MRKTIRQNHDRDILSIVKGLLLTEIAFGHIYTKHREGRLRFSDIGEWVDDRGKSLLYNLKEKSHALFRFNRRKTLRKEESLLDLAIGSIFHEAMKLRENLYQLEVYRPRYLQYRTRAGSSTYEKDYLQRFEKIISRAEEGIREGMEETRSLLRDAMAQLIDFFKKNNRNPFLVRFILEHQDLLGQVYPGGAGENLFHVIFDRGYLDAYAACARSYLESEHYDLSTEYFSKALEVASDDRNLQFLFHFSSGMNAYYKNTYDQGIDHFSKLVRLGSPGRETEASLRKAEEACRKMASELQEEKKLEPARKADLLAQQLKACYKSR